MHLSGWFTSSMAEFLGQAILLRPRRQPARVCAHCLSAPDFAVFPSSVTVLLLPQVILILCLQLNFWLHGVPSKAIVSWLGRCSWSHSVLNRSLLFHYIVRKTTASLKKKKKNKALKTWSLCADPGQVHFFLPFSTLAYKRVHLHGCWEWASETVRYVRTFPCFWVLGCYTSFLWFLLFLILWFLQFRVLKAVDW